MVSDKGLIYEVDESGKILKTAAFKGSDIEGVCRRGEFVYATDERLRQVHVFNAADLSLVKTISVPFPGPRNSGYEGICYNEVKKCWMLAVEKSDPTLIELDDDFHIKAQYAVKGIADISSITWYNGHITCSAMKTINSRN
jgi:uncharacterized protein YjiK